jgi:PST family polysaccharide transporter
VFLGVASSKWFIAEGRQVLSLQRTVIGAFVNVALNLLLIPNYGGIGAALATLITQFAAAFLFDITHNVTRSMFFMKLKAMNPLRLKSIFH